MSFLAARHFSLCHLCHSSVDFLQIIFFKLAPHYESWVYLFFLTLHREIYLKYPVFILEEQLESNVTIFNIPVEPSFHIAVYYLQVLNAHFVAAQMWENVNPILSFSRSH